MQAVQSIFGLLLGFVGDKAIAPGETLQGASLVKQEVKFFNIAILFQNLYKLKLRQPGVKIPDPYTLLLCFLGEWLHGQRYSRVLWEEGKAVTKLAD